MDEDDKYKPTLAYIAYKLSRDMLSRLPLKKNDLLFLPVVVAIDFSHLVLMNYIGLYYYNYLLACGERGYGSRNYLSVDTTREKKIEYAIRIRDGRGTCNHFQHPYATLLSLVHSTYMNLLTKMNEL
jgi:hypothetical protein